ncbi:Cof-type HAD-IIB family hydrolase [Sporolactobacillus sp. THM7-4]|nr:Cof-type HAD-IIB family hydrolase [Sporolactobacillus sp. THM7-4]
MYQSILMDLDGTVLTPVNTVTDELNDYLKFLRNHGVHVFAVTGRTYQEAWNVLPDDFPAEGMVTANGMAVYVGSEKVLQHALPGELVETLINRARDERLYYEMHPISGGRAALLEDQSYFREQIHGKRPETVAENEWLSRLNAVNQEIDWKNAVTKEECSEMNKLYFFSTDVAKMDRWKKELSRLAERTPFDCFSSTRNNTEVIVKGISKASGIRYLMDYCHLSLGSALVVGDGENDLPMFQAAGHSAAMKNAPDHVKKQADEVTDYSYAENGLYRFLKKSFNLG